MIPPEQKQAWIDQFFSNTGPTYDEVVHRATFGVDRLWKKKILEKLPPSPQRILDLACGTGLLTFALARKFPTCQIVGVDISKGYLDQAERKAERLKIRNVKLIHSRAEDIHPDERFDAVTTSYLPKYADLNRLIPNLAKMLAPGGVMVFHDFTYPTSKPLRALFHLYFKLLPPIGGRRYPEWKEVFVELPNVIRKTQWVAESTALLRQEGLSEIKIESLTLQGSALVTGRKS